VRKTPVEILPGVTTFVPVSRTISRIENEFGSVFGGIEVSVVDPAGRPIEGAAVKVLGLDKNLWADEDDTFF
jgi:hypothetical protein